MAVSSQPRLARINPALGTLVLLIGLNLLNYIDRYILPGEVSLVQHEFHSTDQQMGALTTALFILSPSTSKSLAASQTSSASAPEVK